MSKPKIKPHVVAGLNDGQWNALETVAKNHGCPSVSLMLMAVANGTLVIDWAWKWNSPAGVLVDMRWPDERLPWA